MTKKRKLKTVKQEFTETGACKQVVLLTCEVAKLKTPSWRGGKGRRGSTEKAEWDLLSKCQARGEG